MSKALDRLREIEAEFGDLQHAPKEIRERAYGKWASEVLADSVARQEARTRPRLKKIVECLQAQQLEFT